MSTDSRNSSIVVAEHGSRWAPWAERFRMDGPDVVVILQRRGESSAKLPLRVRGRPAELGREGRPPARAVVVGGGRTDADALSARSLTIRSIAAEMANNGGGTLMLDDAGADRFSMAALAATVAELTRGSGVVVAHAGATADLARVA